MEIVYRKSQYKHTVEGVLDEQATELTLSSLDSAVATVLALAIAGGVYLSGGDIAEQLKRSSVIDISASATQVHPQTNPIRRRLNFDALTARARDLASVEDARQTTFEFREVEGEDILDLVNRHGGAAIVQRDTATGVIDTITASFTTEYDSEEMLEVLESLEATGTPVTPQKLVGDLAQTSIVNGTNQEQIICLAEWSISWKRKMVEATTTDDALYESSLGSSKSWTAKAKYMFVDGDQSQIDGVLSAINTTALAALSWQFFPTVALGRQAFQGLAFIDGIDLSSGSGKIVGLDVSLKGTGPLNLKTQIAPTVNSNTVTGLSGQV